MQVLASKSGLSAKKQGGHAHIATGADVAGFLANTEAYAVAIEIVEKSDLMRLYRDSVAAESAELRNSLEPLISAE